MKKRTRIELHCHTKMSVGKGLIEPGELVRYACDNGYKAIAITDCGNVQAFPEAYRTWKELWKEYVIECQKTGEEARQEDFLKLIYGLEGYLAVDQERYPILLYAKNETGIRNLYRIVTESDLSNSDENPTITREIIDKFRDGILVGAVCDGGEPMIAIHTELGSRSDAQYRRDFKNILSFYDFIEVSPFGSDNGNDVRYMYHVLKNDGMLVAASDAYYLDEKDKILWDILTNGGAEVYADRPRHLMKWDEMNNTFRCWNSGYPSILKKIPEMVIENQPVIADQIEYVSPIREGKFIPAYPDAEQKLRHICEERMHELYGEKPAKEAQDRLYRELDGISNNGYSGLFMMWRDIAQKSMEKGCPITSRGSAASSLVAFFSGITDINPLSAECGGYDIPAETFFGIDFEKEPDIDLNFAPKIQDFIQNFIKELPGVADTCYGGTVAGFTGKSARMYVEEYYSHNNLPLPDESIIKEQIKKLSGIKRKDGHHPGGIIVVPVGEELITFTPLQHPCGRDRISTHFDYHYLTKSLLKFDILGYPPLDILYKLQELTGVAVSVIPMNDEKILKVLCDVEIDEIEGLPEFGSKFARRIVKEVKPAAFDDLIKISGLLHGTDVWHDNQRELVLDHKIKFKDTITSRDEIYLTLFRTGMGKSDAYRIMDSVRKGKGITGDMESKMKQAGVAEWYIDVCRKISYLFPKAHAVANTLVAWRFAYYMTYYPGEYKEALLITG